MSMRDGAHGGADREAVIGNVFSLDSCLAEESLRAVPECSGRTCERSCVVLVALGCLRTSSE
jgi:hypothetical protein